MKYPTMGQAREYQVSLPQLNGGVNYSVLPHLIGDNQLSDVKNLWFRDGVVKTRPGISYVDSMNVASAEPQDFDRYTAGNRNYLSVYYSNPTVKTTEVLFKDGSANRSRVLTTGAANETIVPWFCETDLTIEGRNDQTAPLMYYCDDDHDTGRIFSVEGDNTTELRPYLPKVMKGGIPQKYFTDKTEGTMFEPANLLTGDYRCEYMTDGKGAYFRLPRGGFTNKLTVTVTNKAGTTTEHSVKATDYVSADKATDNNRHLVVEPGDFDTGKIYLVADPAEGVFWFSVNGNIESPAVLAETNIANDVSVVVYTKNSEESVETIFGMRFSEWYGGGSSGLTSGTRLFVSGNPKHPNLVHWSSLNNPLYFPDSNYSYVGSDQKCVTGFGKQEDLLVVFKDYELYCTKYYDGSATTAEELEEQDRIDIEAARAVFPIVQLHPSIGCDCPKTICLCNNRLVWFNSDGKVYGLFSAGQYSERNVRELSQCVEKEIKKASGRQNASAAEFEDHYLLLIGNEIFVMDYSSSGFTYYSSYSNDEKAQKAVQWCRWDLGSERKFCEIFNQKGTTVLIERTTDVRYFLFYRLTAPEETVTVDAVCSVDSEIATHGSRAISTRLATKWFDFGHPNRYKRVNPFYLQMSGATDKRVVLTYLNENGAYVDAFSPALTGEDLSTVSPIRVTPNAVRVREFGFMLECDDRMEIGSLILNYSVMGTVR